MELQFKLSITLGNDAMMSQDDLADALRAVANKLAGDIEAEGGMYGAIRDLNGNKVGSYSITKETIK